MRMFFDDEWQLPLTSIITTTPQENNHKIDIKIILICIMYDICKFLLWKQKSLLYTGLQSNYIPSKSVSTYHWPPKPYVSPSPFYHLSIKWTKKKKCQHFIESIHESIMLSGKQCTWMKVNDFPASPSNQYSLYKLMLLLNVR